MALVGKLCPSIGGLTFIKGQAFSIPSKTGPMILEFWASWCGPCRMAFPHLSELQKKFKSRGLAVVGICLEEDSPQTRAFVASQGQKMDYTVAIDSRGEASQKLMGAAGVSGIPHAFIVDAKGQIRHHGHPLEPRFTQAVEQVCQEAAAPPPAPPKVTKSREELLASPVRELKQILTDRGIYFADLHEKPELVDRILEKCASLPHILGTLLALKLLAAPNPRDT